MSLAALRLEFLREDNYNSIHTEANSAKLKFKAAILDFMMSKNHFFLSLSLRVCCEYLWSLNITC